MFKKTKSLMFWRLLAIFGLVLLFWAGFRDKPIPQYTHDFDKVTHVVGFAVVTFTCLMAFTFNGWVIIPIFLMILGFSIEVGQELFLPMRTFDWGDFKMDAIGILVGVALTMPFRFWSVHAKTAP